MNSSYSSRRAFLRTVAAGAGGILVAPGLLDAMGACAPQRYPIGSDEADGWDRVPGILKQYGGKVIVRGGKYQIMEGPEFFHRFIVIEFDSLEAGVKCFESPEYREAAAFRRNGAGVVENVIVEGGEATK